jgi:hypothetical protein
MCAAENRQITDRPPVFRAGRQPTRPKRFQASSLEARNAGPPRTRVWTGKGMLPGSSPFPRLEDAGLIGTAPLPEDLRSALGLTGDDADEDEDSTASAADDDGDEDYAGLRWAKE